MFRVPNTTRSGGGFDVSTVAAVWDKARVVSGQDPTQVRKDACGAWIRRREYGQTTEYGWEIDHIVPVASGGTDRLENLQPLHWRNNRHKGDDYPNWTCAVSAR